MLNSQHSGDRVKIATNKYQAGLDDRVRSCLKNTKRKRESRLSKPTHRSLWPIRCLAGCYALFQEGLTNDFTHPLKCGQLEKVCIRLRARVKSQEWPHNLPKYKLTELIKNRRIYCEQGEGCSLVLDSLSSLCKALGLTPVLTKKARLSLEFMETWIQDSF